MEKAVIAVTTTTTTTSSRLKREDCSRTKHDSVFSYWKFLIGPSDWEDHLNGKEGAERYKTQNLPNCTSCTGVYELGIAIWRSKTGRETGKLDPDFVIPVYLGKADNVRNRIQQYGRDGAHLENAQIGPGLFRDIFAKGYSIVYRWAPMKNTRDAEKTESDLLDKFDYAWNRGSNGARRPNDIIKKLSPISKTSAFVAKLQLLTQKRKGIKIKAYEPPFLENGMNFYTNLETNGLLNRIFKIGRSQPRLVIRYGVNENHTTMCGVALGHGVICKRPPAEGKTRCTEHKGMKINSFSSKLLTDGKFPVVAVDNPIKKDLTPVCGVILDDGSCCTSKPVQGNKRCLEHKGRKICSSTHQPMKEKKDCYVQGPILDCDISPSKAGKQCIDKNYRSTICGMDLDDGTFCTRQPPAGRKRCEEHKGMRIKETSSTSFREKIPSVFENSGSRNSREKSQNYSFIPSVFDEKISPTCEAVLHNGSFCSRKPMEGNKRCWQHKGVRVGTSPGNSSNSKQTVTSQYASYTSVYEDFSSSCGAALQNGSFCSRKPTEGNKRCWQHQGMRVDSRPLRSNNSYHYASYGSVYENFSSTCGAPTRNGSYCRRSTAGGRCWQHGG
ncbi:hypothetical protein ACH5RR_006118 [Cinchona calisaya]|uniref:Protein EFFECTOR OF TRANSCRIPTION 2-like n=1 Tax=Cinchona calisaya TaxID=153742 RepID=A0ABD3AN55_9GENT